MKTRVLFTIALTGILMCSGCMNCTQWASRIGTSRIEVTPITVSRTTESNLVVAMQFIRRDAGVSAIHSDLGPRYAFFSPKLLEDDVRRAMASRAYLHYHDDRFTWEPYVISAMIPATNTDSICQTPRWYLYPATFGKVRAPVSLPVRLSQDTNCLVSFWKGYDRYSAAVQQNIDSTSYAIRLQLFPYEALDGLADTTEHALWAPPVRWVLYPIVIVVDIITGPFQFYSWAQGFKHGG